MTRYNTSEKGFTLIEGIIATGIISTALIVGLSLAYSNMTAAQTNADRVIAGNLAREGIEVMRNLRDSNWLKRAVNVDKNPTTPTVTDYYAWDDVYDTELLATQGFEPEIVRYLDIYLDPNFGFGGEFQNRYALKKIPETGPPADLLSCIGAGDPSCRIQKKNGIYFQASALDSDATPLPYFRRIAVKPVCWNGSSEYVYENAAPLDSNCPVGEEKIGHLVISHVVWQRGAKTLEVKVKEKLYDWRSL